MPLLILAFMIPPGKVLLTNLGQYLSRMRIRSLLSRKDGSGIATATFLFPITIPLLITTLFLTIPLTTPITPSTPRKFLPQSPHTL
ncbi:hypothetical protein QBC36DRAFT_294921 [Triangularia setosa]|uniref:Uncharacterized protein n=1 Tax=Triangularia setosa TaxID=2587417 RepID=A0AAN6VYZ2_9PEZI|nr:hypothetical protein QBC36DRAFT_294921 [Podospora setosa]